MAYRSAIILLQDNQVALIELVVRSSRDGWPEQPVTISG
jgi:hypothetical protein